MLLAGVAVLALVGCGAEVELLAADACDLAQRIADDEIGLLALGLELDSLSRELRDASVSARALREAMSELCPEVADELPL